jgi:hypothetical protein
MAELAGLDVSKHPSLPSYTTSWAATGPLMEKHRVWLIAILDGDWMAGLPGHQVVDAKPLVAVCRVILKARGML